MLLSPRQTPQYPMAASIRGQSLRLLYNNSLNEVGTNVQLVCYRYYSFAYITYSRMSGYDV